MEDKLAKKLKKNGEICLGIYISTGVLTIPLLAIPSVFGATAGAAASLGIPVVEGLVVAETLAKIRGGYLVAQGANAIVTPVVNVVVAWFKNKDGKMKEE